VNIYKAISEIMAEVGPIGKEKRNQQQGFNFRGIDDVMNVLSPVLSRHGVFIVPEVLEMSREEKQTAKGGTLLYSILKTKFTFYADDGSNLSAIVIGEGMDSGDKASNKAMAIGLKYALLQVFCIPTEELVDPDAESPEIRSQPETRKKYGDMSDKEKLVYMAEVFSSRLENLPQDTLVVWRKRYGEKDDIAWKVDVVARAGVEVEFQEILPAIPEQFKPKWISKYQATESTAEAKDFIRELKGFLEAGQK